MVQNCSGLINRPQRVLSVLHPLLVRHVFSVPSVQHPQNTPCTLSSLAPRARSCMQNQRKCSLLRTEKGQLMNRLPLCSRSKPLYTAPANHQQPLYGFLSTGNISCAEPTQCLFCLQRRGVRVALRRKLSMYVQGPHPAGSSWCW